MRAGVKTWAKERKPLQVLMVSNVYFPVVGGISTYIYDLSKVIEANGGKVRIASFPSFLSRAPRTLRWLFYLGFIARIVFLAGLMRLNGKSPVIHSHSASFCLAAGAVCRRFFGCRAVHTFHSPLDQPSLSLNLWVPHVDVVVYVAEATRQLYRSHGVPEHKVETLIAGGVDIDRYIPPVRRLADGDNKVLILFVGRICREKGIREAITAMAVMQHQAQLLIVGVAQNETQRAYENELRAIVAKDPALADQVVFRGGLRGDALLEAFQSADVFVVPSLWEEPAPMVIAEAFASGLPVVAFDSGGLRERVHDGRDGLIVPRGDIAGLAAGFDRLVSEPELRREMGRAARIRAEGEFSLSAMYLKYRRIYAS